MEYQNKRGGTVIFQDIKAPSPTTWPTAKDAMIEALNLEKEVNKVSYACLEFYCVSINFDAIVNIGDREKKDNDFFFFVSGNYRETRIYHL